MQRVFLGNSGGGTVFRVSKPGASITSSNLGDFLIHEDMYDTIPVATGTVSSLPYYGTIPPTAPYYETFYDYRLTIGHDLGYVPLILATYNIDVGVWADDTALYFDLEYTSQESSFGLSPSISYAIFAIQVG